MKTQTINCDNCQKQIPHNSDRCFITIFDQDNDCAFLNKRKDMDFCSECALRFLMHRTTPIVQADPQPHIGPATASSYASIVSDLCKKNGQLEIDKGELLSKNLRLQTERDQSNHRLHVLTAEIAVLKAVRKRSIYEKKEIEAIAGDLREALFTILEKPKAVSSFSSKSNDDDLRKYKYK